MRLVTLAVDEEGKEDEEEEDEEEEEEEGKEKEMKKETEKLTVKKQQRYMGCYEIHGPTMRSLATIALGIKNQRPAMACSIFVVSPPPLLLLLLLLLQLPTSVLTIVVDASPLYPMPPYKSELRFIFLC